VTFSIAYLSDPHITTGADAAAPAHGLSRALERVLTIDPRPDCVVITGDLVNNGHPDEYAALRELIDDFPIPLHLVPGNHDDPEALVAEFGDTGFLGDGLDTAYVVGHEGFTLVVLRSTVPGRPHGQLDADQLAWLDKTLADRPDVPAFVCVHHPPMRVGIPSLDAMGLFGTDALADVVRGHPHVVRILSGHIHRPITGTFAGTTVSIAPSTWKQTALRLRELDYAYTDEPTSFLLHLATETGVVTHTLTAASSS
jgi:3',5'-cyclic-AMP phosphodiesterase